MHPLYKGVLKITTPPSSDRDEVPNKGAWQLVS
jgi:hypothetical protein